MNSEENTLKLIEMLDEAVKEIDKIDERLKAYEDKINAVGDAVRVVGERDNVIQLQQQNQQSLLEILDGLMSSLEFSRENSKFLTDYDFSSSDRIDRCVRAANHLIDILETDFPPALRKMKACEEQLNYLERLKLNFCSNSQNHLKNAIGHAVINNYFLFNRSLFLSPINFLNSFTFKKNQNKS